MSLISLVLTLVVVGVLLWALNSLAGEYIDAKILKIINVVVVLCVILWVVFAILGHGNVANIQVPQVR